MYVYDINIYLTDRPVAYAAPDKNYITPIYDNEKGAKIVGSMEYNKLKYAFEIELYDVSIEEYDFLENDFYHNDNGMIKTYIRNHIKCDIELNRKFIERGLKDV